MKKTIIKAPVVIGTLLVSGVGGGIFGLGCAKVGQDIIDHYGLDEED